MFQVLDRERTVAKPGFNRWLVPPAALSVHLAIGQAYAFSVFNLPMTRLLGITRSVPGDWKLTTLGWIFSFAIVCLGLAASFGGKWVERAGPRKAMFASACCFCGGFMVAALGVWLHDIAIVYLGYGVSWLINISAEEQGIGAGVLFRAGEPTFGVETMMGRRGKGRLSELTSGPGKLCMAMGIDQTQNGTSYFDGGPIWLGEAQRPAAEISVSVRIGITKDAERPLRFYERGNPFVSGPKKLSP